MGLLFNLNSVKSLNVVITGAYKRSVVIYPILLLTSSHIRQIVKSIQRWLLANASAECQFLSEKGKIQFNEKEKTLHCKYETKIHIYLAYMC